MPKEFAMNTRKMMLTALAATIIVPGTASHDASARDRAYRGHDRHYESRCKRSDGTTGLIVGGAGGALAGNALGGGTLGTVAGGVGGALLGKHIDKKNNARNNRRRDC
jgi:outer membrane lipoprotein SlyB